MVIQQVIAPLPYCPNDNFTQLETAFSRIGSKMGILNDCTHNDDIKCTGSCSRGRPQSILKAAVSFGSCFRFYSLLGWECEVVHQELYFIRGTKNPVGTIRQHSNDLSLEVIFFVREKSFGNPKTQFQIW